MFYKNQHISSQAHQSQSMYLTDIYNIVFVLLSRSNIHLLGTTNVISLFALFSFFLL